MPVVVMISPDSTIKCFISPSIQNDEPDSQSQSDPRAKHRVESGLRHRGRNVLTFSAIVVFDDESVVV
jgi:hypothetical protein